MLERWVRGVWFGKRFTTDEHVIGLENGKVGEDDECPTEVA